MADSAALVTAHERRENLVVLTTTAFLRGAHTTVYNVIWQPFVLSLGASMPTLGLLNSIGGMNGLVTTIVQALGGWMADRLGRRPFILAASGLTIIGYGLFALAGWLNSWTIVGLGVFFLGAVAISFPARNSMTAESVRTDQHGSAFSLITVAGLIPGVLAPATGGWIADRFGLLSVFPIMIVLEAISLGLVWRYLHETCAPDPGGINIKGVTAALVRSIVPPKGLGGFFLAVAGDSFSWGMGWGLLYGMLTETFHFTVEQLGIMSSVMSLTWAIAQMPIGRYIDRHNLKWVMIVSEAIGIPLMLIWITQSSFEIFAASEMLFALTAATWVPVVNTYLTRRVSPAERAEAFGRLNVFRGLLAFPAPALGGVLYAWGGMQLPLIGNLAGIFFVIAILVTFVREPSSQVSVRPSAAA